MLIIELLSEESGIGYGFVDNSEEESLVHVV